MRRLFAALLMSAPASGATAKKCMPHGSQTMRSTASIRVYRDPERGASYACYRPTGKTRRLAREEWTGAAAVAGAYVAFAYENCDSHGDCVSRGIRVLNVKTGALRKSAPGHESSVGQIVVSDRGSAGWIYVGPSDRVYTDIDQESLALRHGDPPTLRRERAGVAKSAPPR